MDDTIDPPPVTTPRTAREMFDQDVYSVVSTQCAGCHTNGPQTNFVGTAATGYDTATKYTAFVGDFSPSDAPVLTKIAAGHQSKTYSTTELAAITGWLNQEVSERTAGAVPPPDPTNPTPTTESAAAATTRVLTAWSGCMTLANFNTANMAQAWGTMQAGNADQCQQCHTNGGQGFVASELTSTFFNLITKHRQYMTQYFAVDLTHGTAMAKVIINTVSFQQVGTGIAPHTEHPRFNPTNNQGMTALNQFYTTTAANAACGAPTLTD